MENLNLNEIEDIKEFVDSKRKQVKRQVSQKTLDALKAGREKRQKNAIEKKQVSIIKKVEPVYESIIEPIKFKREYKKREPLPEKPEKPENPDKPDKKVQYNLQHINDTVSNLKSVLDMQKIVIDNLNKKKEKKPIKSNKSKKEPVINTLDFTIKDKNLNDIMMDSDDKLNDILRAFNII